MCPKGFEVPNVLIGRDLLSLVDGTIQISLDLE